jgi:hypothetical protein
LVAAATGPVTVMATNEANKAFFILISLIKGLRAQADMYWEVHVAELAAWCALFGDRGTPRSGSRDTQ